MEKNINLGCPHCGNSNIRKYGYTTTKKQRFYCNGCHKTFTTDTSKFKISKKSKQVLGLLYNLLDKDFYDSESLQLALCNACLQEKELNLNDVYYDCCLEIHKVHGSSLKYECYNPKLIVCVDNNKLKLYKIHPANKDVRHNYRNIVIHEVLHKN